MFCYLACFPTFFSYFSCTTDLNPHLPGRHFTLPIEVDNLRVSYPQTANSPSHRIYRVVLSPGTDNNSAAEQPVMLPMLQTQSDSKWYSLCTTSPLFLSLPPSFTNSSQLHPL